MICHLGCTPSFPNLNNLNSNLWKNSVLLLLLQELTTVNI